MKKLLLLTCLLLSSVYVSAQSLSPAEQSRFESQIQNYKADPNAVSWELAWYLYRSEDVTDHVTADAVLEKYIAKQDPDPESITFGQWGWRWENGEKVVDFNNALFSADRFFNLLWVQQSKMSSETRKQFMIACNRLTEAAVRRWETEVFDIGRDFTAYSNIFALYVETFALAGERFDDYRLQKMAKSQWTRWYNHIQFFGVDEFASPNYNHLIFRHLPNIAECIHDERIKREVHEVMDHLYLLQSALNHPVLKIPITGISRDYRNFTINDDVRSGVVTDPIDGYTPPAKAVKINEHRKYPFKAVGKAAINPFIYQTYQLPNAGMGSMTGGNCYEQQIHCMVAVGENEKERAEAFLQGSFTPVNGFTDQIETSTFCVYNRLPTYWQFTQWRGDMSTYLETIDDFGMGISGDWQEKENAAGHIVLEAYGYDLHLFPFTVRNEKIEPCELELKHRDNTCSSGRYHPRPREYDEYVFPDGPMWFGMYVVLAEKGEKVKAPKIKYEFKDGIRTFTTNKGHKIRVFVAEKGDSRQLFNVDPALIPILKIYE